MKNKQVKDKNLGLKIAIVILSIIVFLGMVYIINRNIHLQEAQNRIQSNILDIVSENEIQQDIQEDNQVSRSANELFEEYYAKAEAMMQTMTLEEKVSQMFITRCPETNAVEIVEAYQLGGYILFGRDFENKTKEQVINQIQAFQKASKMPMIIGVDEEGGTVVRISQNPNLAQNRFLSPQALYKQGGLDKIREDTIEKSKLLWNLGINLNLAPVADVSTSSLDFIYPRSYGQNAQETAKYIETVVKAMKTQKVACTLKHFPGYGNNKDSHTAVTYDNRGMESFRNSDFIPFQAGIDSGAETVLVCHNIVKAIDPNIPASLSKKVHDILREELHFTGLIMTDDLSMSAITEYTSSSDAAILSVEAGNDLILTSDFQKQRESVITAVKDKRITQERIEESVRRIIAYKYAKGLIKV